MAKFLLLIAGVIASSLASASNTDDVRDFVAAYSATWNRHDERELAKLFDDGADLLMGGMPRIEGRAKIQQWWRIYFLHLDPDRRGDFEIASVMVLADDVRLVNVLTRTGGKRANGKTLETRRARGTWILVRRNDSWRIQAMRGNPAVGESRSKPGTDR